MNTKWVGSSILAVLFLGLMATQAYAVATNVKLVGAGGSPVAKAKVEVTSTDGTKTKGTTGTNGEVTLDVDPQNVKETEVTTQEGEKRRRAGPWFLTGDIVTLDFTTMTPVAGAAATAAVPTERAKEPFWYSLKRWEWYVAGLVGWNSPSRLSNVQGIQEQQGLSFSDFDLQSNPIYEAKIGGYSPKLGQNFRVGFEFSGSYATPHIKDQTLTARFGGTSLTERESGFHARLFTGAFHALVRWDGLGDFSPSLKNFSPYGGIGPAIGWFRIAQPPASAANTTLGYSAVYGVRWQSSLDHVALWLEGGHRSFSPTFGKDVQIKGDYSDNSVKVGVSWYFTGDATAW